MSRLKTDAIRNVNASVDGITLDTSGNVAIPNELQLADKIVHTGDTDTLIRFPAANNISFETTGGEALRIDSNQRVAIGSTSSGGWKLRVQVDASSSYQSAFNITNNVNADINFEIKNSESRIGPSTNTPLIFKNGGGDRLRITSTGAIQNYYNSSLPVTDSRPILQLGYSAIGDDVSGYNAVTCNAYPVNGNSTWHYIGSSSLGASRYHIGFGDHKWFTAAAGTRGNDITWSEKVRLDSTGRLLVNQNTHQGSTSKLEVTGTLNNSYPGYSFPLMVSDDAAYNSSAGPGGGIGFSFKQNTGGQYAQAGGIRGIKENTTDGNYASALAFYTRPNGAGTAEKLRLDSSGDLQFRNNTTDHQGLKWYSNTGHLGLSFTYGEGNANPTLNIFRWDSQSGFPYGSLIINTGHSTNPTRALKLRTDKHIELNGSLIMANGNGIDFSATSDASGKTSELLDDYEEGSWTPVPSRYTGGAITTNGAITAVGNYTRVGRLVTVEFSIQITGTITQGSNLNYLDGLPYLCVGSYRASGSLSRNTALNVNYTNTCNVHNDFGGVIYFSQATQTTAILNVDWVAGYVNGSITYITSA